MGRSKKQSDEVRNAMYRCRELRSSIEYLGAALGPLSGRDFGGRIIQTAREEIGRQIRSLNAVREEIAKGAGFSDEMETPEIVQSLRAESLRR